MTAGDQSLRRTRIKLCGFTREADIASAVVLGVDALGFVFYPKSKRYVTPEQAQTLVKNVPAFVSTVALFVDPDVGFVREVLDAMHPTVLQLHGNETPEFCDALGFPYLKAFRVGAPGLMTPTQLHQICRTFDQANGWLFDSYTPAYGGSGHGFDRALLSEVLKDPKSKPIILSGGLTPENVQQQVSQLQPWAVDVSSGIEEQPGLKSVEKMISFVQAIRRADAL